MVGHLDQSCIVDVCGRVVAPVSIKLSVNVGVATGDVGISIATVMLGCRCGQLSQYMYIAHSDARFWFCCAASGIRYSLVSQQSAYSSTESSPTGMAVGVAMCHYCQRNRSFFLFWFVMNSFQE